MRTKPTPRQRSALIALATCALSALPLYASLQDDLEIFTDRVEVRLVEVEVLVTDRDDAPVYGLTAEDFELRVGDEGVPLRHFVPAAAPRPPAATGQVMEAPAGPAPALTEERLKSTTSLVIYLDLAYLRPGELHDLVAPLEGFLASQLAAGSRLTLVSADRGLETLRALEAPLPPLLPVFEEITTRLGRGERLRQEYNDLRGTIARTLDGDQFDPLLDRQPNRDLPLLMARIERFAEAARREAEITTAQLRFLTSALAGLPGRKMVLYVGGRMPLDAGRALAEAWQQAFGAASTRRINIAINADPGFSTTTVAPNEVFQFNSVPLPELPETSADPFTTLAAEASSQGVVFYTFDASRGDTGSGASLAQGEGTLEGITGSASDFSSTQRSAHHRALASLAAGSGGRSLGSRRNLPALLTALRGHLDGGYLLGFEPPPSADEGPQRLEIRLREEKRVADGGELRLQYRRFIRHLPPDREAADRTLTALALHHVQPSPTNPLGITLEFGERQPGEAGGELLPITVRVPFSRLALHTETWAHSGQLSIFFTAGGLEEGALPVRKAVLPLRVANEDLLGAFGRQVEYLLEIQIPAGAPAVAVSVRDDLAPTLSTVVQLLTQPASDAPGEP